MDKLRIATRKSQMALAQAQWVKQQLEQLTPGLNCELIPMTTEGDQRLSMPLATIGGKGLFLKELENALIDNKADIAVHSLKDVTVEMPPGLHLTTFCERLEARDVLVANNDYADLNALPVKAHVGTSSLRRQALVKMLRPDLRISSLRGNVNTRLRKLDDGEYDAIILSGAGLQRIDLSERINCFLDPQQFIPAVGQGTLTIQCRIEDQAIMDICQCLDHAPTRSCVTAERAFNQSLQGGCQLPIAGYAEFKRNVIHLQGLVASVDGQTILREQINGNPEQAEELGETLARRLISLGADELILAAQQNHG